MQMRFQYSCVHVIFLLQINHRMKQAHACVRKKNAARGVSQYHHVLRTRQRACLYHHERNSAHAPPTRRTLRRGWLDIIIRNFRP